MVGQQKQISDYPDTLDMLDMQASRQSEPNFDDVPVEVYEQTIPSDNLATRLIKIMKEAGSIEKLGFNSSQKYTYIKESDISKKMQGLFCKYGIFVLANTVSNKATPFTNTNGKSQIFSQVEIEYTFINADNPSETYTVKAYGEGMDTGDKAGYKASTGCHKYFLIRNFNLGSDEDAEKESPELGTRQPVTPPPSQPMPPRQNIAPQVNSAPRTAPNRYNNTI